MKALEFHINRSEQLDNIVYMSIWECVSLSHLEAPLYAYTTSGIEIESISHISVKHSKNY